MDYEDIDNILRSREYSDCSNNQSVKCSYDENLSHKQLLPFCLDMDMRNACSPSRGFNDQTTDLTSAKDDESVVYARVNRGDKNSSRLVECWNPYSGSKSCHNEENMNDLYSMVRKESASSGAGFDNYRGCNNLTVGHMKYDDVASPNCDFYQLEKPVESPYFGVESQPVHFPCDFLFNPYEEVYTRGFSNRDRDFDVNQGESGIYSCIQSDSWIEDRRKQENMSLTGAMCTRCQQGFSKDEEIVNSNGQIWHRKCFVCGQCFQQFPDGVFYEFEGRKYCEHDFNVLFAPCCGQCKEFIIGRVIKAMNLSWHPDCFSCQLCQAPLADAGFIKNAGRALCRECNAKEKARGTGKYVCHKCHSIIEEGHIKFKGEAYHPYHFNCTTCSVELNADAREKGGELYCLRCHDKMGIPICGACRRPIEERVVYALGKAWHVEHFVCAKCEKPFLGTRHYEKKGLAYCETHYHQLFGNICFVCNCVVAGDVFTALNKAWCVDHFACSVCDRKMSQKTKFFEVDLKPVCKMCYEKFPAELKKRLKKAYDQQMKK